MGVEDILASAKKTLSDANTKFPSVSPTPSHEFSDAPYSMANTLKKVGSAIKGHTGDQGESTGNELKAKTDMIKKVQ